MLATLDLVARSDWVTVLPGIMMALDTGTPRLTVNPLAGPSLPLDLVMIEPSRRTMSDVARAFLATLEAESRRLNLRWAPTRIAASPARRTRRVLVR
jgi:DNA-binding transcriptional LysR family regulator